MDLKITKTTACSLLCKGLSKEEVSEKLSVPLNLVTEWFDGIKEGDFISKRLDNLEKTVNQVKAFSGEIKIEDLSLLKKNLELNLVVLASKIVEENLKILSDEGNPVLLAQENIISLNKAADTISKLHNTLFSKDLDNIKNNSLDIEGFVIDDILRD